MSEFSLDLSFSHQICCRLSDSGLGVTVENRSEVSGQRTMHCSGVRTVLGSVVGAGDSQYLASELDGNERR